MAQTVKELVATFGLQTDKASFARGQQAVDGIKSAARTLVTLFAAGAVAQGFRSMVGQASDAAEAMNVITAAFGDHEQQVLDWASTQADAMGRSEFELREYASTLGALIQPMVKNRKATADMSTSLAGLAVDLGSFFNVADSDALLALRSGLTGQTEPLLRFGVNLQVAQLEAFRLSRGIGKSVSQMSEAEKVQLRYQLIMQQTANAQGDAAKTADGYANATKAVAAAVKDITTRIGQAFLPGMERAVLRTRFLVRQVLAWVKANEEVIKSRIDKFMQRLGSLAEHLFNFTSRLVVAVKDWADGLDESQMMMLKIAGIAALMAAVLLLPGGSILLLIGLIALLIDDFETWRSGGESVIGDLIGSVDELKAAVGPGLLDAMAFAWEGIKSFLLMIQDGFFSLIQFVIDIFDVGFVQAVSNLLTNLAESGFGQFFKDIANGVVVAVKHWASLIWDTMTDLFLRLGKWVQENTIIGKVIARASGAAGALAGGGGFGDALRALAGGGASPAVTPRGGGGLNNQQTSSVNVNVNVPPGANEQQVAQLVAEEVDARLEAQNRATIDALTVGAGG